MAHDKKLDDAARAAWLYYVGQNTQDEVATKLGVSRQSAQRLIALASTEGLIRVRVDHPVARCLDLSEQLNRRFELRDCVVVPSDPLDPFSNLGIAQAGAGVIQRYLDAADPQILAFGTGRLLRACVEQIEPTVQSPHRLVSLLGNIMSDGRASAFNVVVRLADRVNAAHYPMPIPPFAESVEQANQYLSQTPVKVILQLIEQAAVSFVGIGQMGDNSPLVKDGFLSPDELQSLADQGAIGEITGWSFDARGQVIHGSVSARVTSAELKRTQTSVRYGISAGLDKRDATLAALRGQLINGLITNEAMADWLIRQG